MRLTSLIVLLAIVGGAAFCLIHGPTREMIFGKAKELGQQARGFGVAKTPREAVDLFVRAVKERDYAAAAKYCSGDYADKLRKAHAGASELGGIIDGINSQIDDKGFKQDEITILLGALDPFPSNLKIGDVKELKDKEGKSKDLAATVFLPEINPNLQPIRATELQSLDQKMLVLYANCLRSPILGPPLGTAMKIKALGAGDDRHWEIDVPMTQFQHDAITYYMDHYKAYVQGMSNFRDHIRQGRFLKDDLPRELKDVLRRSK